MNKDLENKTAEIAAKEQMLAIVFHDIKNPLAAIQLEAQMLLRSAERDGKTLLAEEVKIQARRILKTTERMKHLVSDLLEKNQFEHGLSKLRKEEHRVRKLISETIETIRPFALDKKINLISSILDDPLISVDHSKLSQVISNLLNNAIKFTPAGGSIEVGFIESDLEYLFSVEDSGPGLDDCLMKKIFDKYWSLNSPGGTGLGLFICKTIIEAHAGHIYVERGNKHFGACFKFTIPKSIKKREDVSFSFFTEDAEDRKKIYIIDDDDDLREVLSWALSKEGYAIYSFESPKAALECLKRSKTAPDLILVDYYMNGMSGSEFITQKEKIYKNNRCPVLMISGDPLEVERTISRESYQDILTKPVELEGLVRGIKKSFLS